MEFLKGKVVRFKTTDNIELFGLLTNGKKKTNKLIIHLPGMGGDFMIHKLIHLMGEKLPLQGYDLLSINTRGAGIINAFHKKKKIFVGGTALEKFEECVYDIQGVINAAKKQGYKEIILSGHSTGCQKIVYYMNKKKNKSVKKLILLAPADDYNYAKKNIKNLSQKIKQAKKLIKLKKGRQLMDIGSYQSAERFLSYISPKNPEMQLFNYQGNLKMFSKIKIPILAVIGSKDHYCVIPAKEMLKRLSNKTNSSYFKPLLIQEVNHHFSKKANLLFKEIHSFLKKT